MFSSRSNRPPQNIPSAAEVLAFHLANTPVNLYSIALAALSRSPTKGIGASAGASLDPGIEDLCGSLPPSQGEWLQARARELRLTTSPHLVTSIPHSRRERLLEPLAERVVTWAGKRTLSAIEMGLDQRHLGPREGRRYLAEVIFEELWNRSLSMPGGRPVARHECELAFMLLLKMP